MDLRRGVDEQQILSMFFSRTHKWSKKPRLWKRVVMVSATSVCICWLDSGECCFKYCFLLIFLVATVSFSFSRKTLFLEVLLQLIVESSSGLVRCTCFKPKHVCLHHLHSQRHFTLLLYTFTFRISVFKKILWWGLDRCSTAEKLLPTPAEPIFLFTTEMAVWSRNYY